MNKEQRRKASVDLTIAYLSSYYSDWRLAKVLTIEKILSQRYDFYNDLIPQIRGDHDSHGDATIAQEIKHGLYFDAIAHCVQYVEDLFALIRAAQQPDYFVRNVITYKAGEITNFIKSFAVDSKAVSEIYHYPNDLIFVEGRASEGYKDGVEKMISLTTDIIKFYKEYEFFYNQYKHGLSVAMRPLGHFVYR